MACELSAENNLSAKQQNIHQETHLHWRADTPYGSNDIDMEHMPFCPEQASMEHLIGLLH